MRKGILVGLAVASAVVAGASPAAADHRGSTPGWAHGSIATYGGSVGVSTASRVRIRTQPSLGGRVIGHMSKGERVWVSCHRDLAGWRWFRVKRGTKPGAGIGWARFDNVRLISRAYNIPEC